jgi:glycosyltransferase involved in cell wall biosynthesis
MGWDVLISSLGRRPFTHRRYANRDFTAAIGHHATGADLIHVDALDLAGHLENLRGPPIACTHHNVESELLRRRASASPGPLRWVLLDQARLLEEEERRWLPRAALNVAVSEADERTFRRIAPTANLITVPNGVDLEYYQPVPMSEAGCVFVGGTTWFPNRDALEWFSREILPSLARSESEGAVATWVGTNGGSDRDRFGSIDGLRLTGTVADVRPYLASAACVVVPLRVGGGTRLKILEAWAMGRAVVSTSVGAEGLRVTPGENILIADDAPAFRAAIEVLLGNPVLRHRIGAAARATVERHYSWDVVGATLLSAYAELCRPARESRPD